MSLFDPNFMFTSPLDNPPGLYAAVPIVFGLLLVASIAAFWRRAKLSQGNPVLRRFIRRASKAGMWIGGIGLFLAIMRYIQFPFLSMPIWMYLTVLAGIGLVGYFVYDRSENYPLAIWRWQESHVDRRYRPAARAVREPQRVVRPGLQRGKAKRRR